MKAVFTVVFLCFTMIVFAQQPDGENTSIIIPAEEVEDPESDNSIDLEPIRPQKKDDKSPIRAPKMTPSITGPKKQFSMFDDEEYGNPAELYTKSLERVNKMPAYLEADDDIVGKREDQFLGEYKTKSKHVTIVYRDHGSVDGDLVRIFVDDDIVRSRVSLESGFQGFKLDLRDGVNKIDFQAINTGLVAPNTAEFKVVDAEGNIIASNLWGLAAGVKATIMVVKE